MPTEAETVKIHEMNCFLYTERSVDKFTHHQHVAQFGLERYLGEVEVRGSNPLMLTRRSSEHLVAEIQSLLGERHWHRELVRSEKHGSVTSLTKRSGMFSIRDRGGAPTQHMQIRAWAHASKLSPWC